jgi:hypothetical protein
MSDVERIFNLEIRLLADGSVELSQDAGCGEISSVTLHVSQVRYLFEKARLTSPADEAAKRLAHWLTTIYLEMADLPSYHPGFDVLVERLAVIVHGVIPKEYFPFELFDQISKGD